MTQEEQKIEQTKFKEWNKKIEKSFYLKALNNYAIIGAIICVFLAIVSVITHSHYSLFTGCMVLILMTLGGIGKMLAGIWQTLDEIKDKMNKENSENKENPEE